MDHQMNISKKFAALVKKAQQIKKEFTVGVVNPTSEESLKATILAAEQKLITPILIGPIAKMQKMAKNLNKDICKYECVNVENKIDAARHAIELIKEERLDALMKGDIRTRELMRVIIAYEQTRPDSGRMSHCQVIDAPAYKKLMIFTDAAVNISPDATTKKTIIENALKLSKALGIKNPKIALLAAVENVNVNNQATTDAAILCKMAKRGQLSGFTTDCEIDGPLSIDLAISKEAAVAKHFTPVLTGLPDIFLAPDLNAGNIAIKILDYLANGEGAGIVLGAQVPIILTRRSSPAVEFIVSCALAKIYGGSSGHD